MGLVNVDVSPSSRLHGNSADLWSEVLMTSFRDFELDQHWSHLRTTEASRKWLSFEDQGDGSAELIVPEAWPTRVRPLLTHLEMGAGLTYSSYSQNLTGQTEALRLAIYSENTPRSRMLGC